MDDNIAQQLLDEPKAELHVHLEGTVSPSTLLELSRRHQQEPEQAVALPDGGELAPPAGTGYSIPRLADFKDFIRYYLKITDLLRSPEDLALVAERYVGDCRRQNIAYVEAYFSPTTYRWLGRAPASLFPGLVEAQKIASDGGVELRWIFDVVRNTARSGRSTLEFAEEARRAGVEVAAIGLAGDETVGKPGQFAETFRKAKKLGYKLLAHCGEGTDSSAMRDVWDHLQPERLGHALSVLDDPGLVRELISRGALIEACPCSNIALGFCTDQQHPLPEMIAAGLQVVICSDDPGIFGKDLLDNYMLAYSRGVPLAALLDCARRSLAEARRGSAQPCPPGG